MRSSSTSRSVWRRVQSPSAQPPLTARRRSAMSEMRPVTDKEVRDAAERLRQTRCRAGWWDEHAATAPARHPGRHRTCLRAGTEDRAARPLFSPAGSWRPRLRQGPEAPLRGGTWRVGMNRALPRNARALDAHQGERTQARAARLFSRDGARPTLRMACWRPVGRARQSRLAGSTAPPRQSVGPRLSRTRALPETTAGRRVPPVAAAAAQGRRVTPAPRQAADRRCAGRCGQGRSARRRPAQR
jgi:hypothetical protein